MVEKLRLISHLGIIEAVRIALATNIESLPLTQTKKDIRHDAGFELSSEVEAIAHDQKQGIFKKKWSQIWKDVVKADSHFTPYIAKIDFRKFFH